MNIWEITESPIWLNILFFLIVFDVNIQTDFYVSFVELMLLTPIPEDSVIFWGSVWWRVFGGD